MSSCRSACGSRRDLWLSKEAVRKGYANLPTDTIMLVKQKGLLLIVSAGTLIILLTVVTLFNERIDFASSVALAYQRFQDLNPWGGSGSGYDDGQKAVDEDLLKVTEKLDLSPDQDPFEEKISEPKGPLVRPGANSSEPVKATLLSLVRNEELKELLGSIRQKIGRAHV